MEHLLVDFAMRASEFITHSDHEIIIAKFNFQHDPNKILNDSIKGTAKGNRIIYLYDKATNEDWDRYKEMINNHPLLHKLNNMMASDHITNEELNQAWDIIMDIIQEAANESIPNYVTDKKSDNLYSDESILEVWLDRSQAKLYNFYKRGLTILGNKQDLSLSRSMKQI